MTKIKIEVEIDLSDKIESEALSNLVQVLGRNGTVATETVTEEPKEVKPAPKKRKPRASKPKEDPKVETPEEPAEETEETPAIEFAMVRKLMAKKLQEGDDSTREACIKQLASLGAKTLPDLSEDKYEEYIEFLNTL